MEELSLEEGSVETEKKIKALNKKLRQIEDLKQAKATGKTLDQPQMDKLASEKSLKEELRILEKQKK